MGLRLEGAERAKVTTEAANFKAAVFRTPGELSFCVGRLHLWVIGLSVTGNSAAEDLLRKILFNLLGVVAMTGVPGWSASVEDHLTTAGKQNWKARDLGPQVTTINIMSAAIAESDTTSPVIYGVVMGEPGRLVGMDIKTGSLLTDLPLAEANGCYATLAAQDGNIYLGSYPNGNLYRYKPGSKLVENVGQVTSNTTFIWDLAQTDDGKIYCACYPDSKVVEYDPVKESFRDLGPAVPKQDYARTVAWHPKRKKLYVGVGSHPALIELDPKTGERKNLTPAEFSKEHFVYHVDVVEDKLVIRLDPSGRLAVFDLASGRLESMLPDYGGSAVSAKSPSEPKFYFIARGKLMEYNLETGEQKVTGATLNGHPRVLHWLSENGKETPTLIAVTNSGHMLRYQAGGGTTSSMALQVPPQPITIHNIFGAPDGKVYSSGYVVGNLGVYDPANGEHKQIRGIGQAEGITAVGSTVYFGVYPKARIYEMETTGPRAYKPRQLFTLAGEDQDRPFGMLGVPEERKVFIGTVPGYGVLGGALAVLDLDKETTSVYRNVVKDHSVVAFAYKDGILYGGTSVSGGLGIEPQLKEGRIFAWDVKKKKKLYDLVPVAGQRAVTCLRFGPEGHLWGWAENHLFIFDPATREVIYSEDKLARSKETVEPLPYKHIWRSAFMTEAQNGVFYGLLKQRLFRLNIDTREVEFLARGGGLDLLIQDKEGNLYSTQKDRLVQFSPMDSAGGKSGN